jgi:hypothetical protein
VVLSPASTRLGSKAKLPSFPRKRESIVLSTLPAAKQKMDSRFRGNDDE